MTDPNQDFANGVGAQLKPCPFCGAIPEWQEFEYGDTFQGMPNDKAGQPFFRVSCEEPLCLSQPTSGFHDLERDAIAAWNTRITQSAPDGNREFSAGVKAIQGSQVPAAEEMRILKRIEGMTTQEVVEWVWRLSAPVSDEEWTRIPKLMKVRNYSSRDELDALIAARAALKGE